VQLSTNEQRALALQIGSTPAKVMQAMRSLAAASIF
jgi:hypothetical protein